MMRSSGRLKGETEKVSSVVRKRSVLLDRDSADLYMDVFDELNIETHEGGLRKVLERSTPFLNDSRPNSLQECSIEITFIADAGFKLARR